MEDTNPNQTRSQYHAESMKPGRTRHEQCDSDQSKSHQHSRNARVQTKNHQETFQIGRGILTTLPLTSWNGHAGGPRWDCLAGEEGLEPPTFGFGGRCSSN